MSRCLGRLINDKIRGKFRDGHHFHIEVRCKNIVEKENAEQLCSKCQQRPRTQMKNHPSCLHGLIGGDIPAWSHLYGSAWYLSKVEAYGEPSESEMARAKKAIAENAGEQAAAPATVEEKPKSKPRKLKIAASETAAPVVETSVPVPDPVVASKPKAKRKPKESVVIPTVASTGTPVVPEEKPKPKGKRKLKLAASEVLPSEPAPVVVQPVALESIKPVETIADEDILMVRVRPFEQNGTTYWLQSSKDKLYTVPKKNELPKYVGRYNRVSETIDHDFPDSDEEH